MPIAQVAPGPDWLALLQTFGVAVCVLLFVGWAGVRVSRWVGAELVIPLRDALIARTVASLAELRQAVLDLRSAVEELREGMVNVCRADIRRIEEGIRRKEI